MPLLSPNPKPGSALRTIGPLIAAGTHEKLHIIDIGSSGGMLPLWHPVAPYATFIGFEPNHEEYEKLMRQSEKKEDGFDVRLYPLALGGRTGTQKFFISNSTPFSDSLLEPNEDFWRRFPNIMQVKAVRETTVETETLDNFARTSGVARADFIKIDTEGSELAILRGGQKLLAEGRVLGIMTEYTWEPNTKYVRDANGRQGMEAFADLDIFLRERGFVLFDLECWRFPRNPLPAGRLIYGRDADGCMKASMPGYYKTYGQMVGGNALYFRDPIRAAQEGKHELVWDEGTILRFILLLDLFNYQDYAMEIADYFRDRIHSVPFDKLIESLTPWLDRDTILPYDEYFKLSCELYKENLPPHLQPLVNIPKVPMAPAAAARAKKAS